MNLPLHIARRYLFAKKSANAINIISGISVFGISVGTAALVLVLSVFNGFEELITSLFNSFNPDAKILPTEGKTFRVDEIDLEKLMAIPGIAAYSETLEEVAFFEYKDNQDFGVLKGVDQHFADVTGIDSTVREGVYRLQNKDREMAVMGLGMRNKLSADVEDFINTITIYMAKVKKGTFGEPFRKRYAYPAGTFVIQQDFDSRYVLCSIDLARELLDQENTVSAIELRIDNSRSIESIMADVATLVGTDFTVKDRKQQDEAFLKLMNIEKWMSFAILSLTLVLVAFNIVGALWMIVLDKRQDISILKSMGATRKDVWQIFIFEGLLLCFVGMAIGFIIALLFYFMQKMFGIVPIPAGFVVDAYPISIRAFDFVAIALTVMGIGFIASLPAARRAATIDPVLLEE